MRKILVVIDMQNDFIDGSLGTKEAQQIVPRVVEKMKEYDPWNIYLTRDTHYENYLDTQEAAICPSSTASRAPTAGSSTMRSPRLRRRRPLSTSPPSAPTGSPVF